LIYKKVSIFFSTQKIVSQIFTSNDFKCCVADFEEIA